MSIKIPMKRTLFSLILVLVWVPALMAGKISDSTWQSGIVKRISTNHLLKSSGHFGQKPPKHGVFLTYYYVEANNYLYEAEEIQTKPGKNPTFAVDQPVKFVINGTEFLVKDEKGKQHRFRLLNSIPEGVSQAAGPK